MKFAQQSVALLALVLAETTRLHGADGVLLDLQQVWNYNTNDLSALNWTAKDYDDSAWSNGPALLYIENNPAVTPRNTPLPARDGTLPYVTYYFRTTFQVTGAPPAFLTFSNLVDDGAVFYLNGAEIFRVRMPAGPIGYSTLATSLPPGNDATAYDVVTIAPANLVTGTNVLAAEVHQQFDTSSDVVFGSALSQSFGHLTRGPYLQLGTPTSVVIRWRTDVPTDTQVLYGTNLSVLDQTNSLPDFITEHEITLMGLNPGTRYFYSVGSATATLAAANSNQYFFTSPVPGTPKRTRIWVLGDAGTSATFNPVLVAAQTAVRNAFYQLNGTNHTDLWLQLGDNAYDSGTDNEYQVAVFDMYSEMLRKSVTWPTLGNHDSAQSTAFTTNYPYFAMFTLPAAGEAGGVPSGTEHYYSFDYANIHFICLDSMTADRSPGGAMAVWLESDLQANTNQWIIAYWHHPPYSKGSHDSDYDTELGSMRQTFLPILEAYGADLVLSGHSHSYERSYLLNGHYGQSDTFTPTMALDSGTGREEEAGAYLKPRGYDIPNRGTVYTVAGSSGQTSGGTLNHPAMCISTNVLGSMLIEIESNRLDAVFLRETGETNDHFTILKANFPPVASNLSFTIGADSTAKLSLAGSDINRDVIKFATVAMPAHGLVSSPDLLTGEFYYTPARGFNSSDVFSFRVSDGQTNSTAATVTISVTPPLDTNHNGLADDWESQFNITDPNADEDSDGMTNLQEYHAGTNPRDSNSWLRITSLSGTVSTGFTLEWPSVAGVRYRVLWSDGGPGGAFNSNFTPLIRPVTEEMDPLPVGWNSTMSFTDDFTLTGAPTNEARYYRIQIVQ